MKVLLLSSYRAKDENEVSTSVLVDARIAALQALKLGVICVLGGPDCDNLLRQSERIHDVEIVYDTNSNFTLLSNARAGVFAAPGEALFVMPLELEVPPKAVWNFLKNEHGKIGFATDHTFLHTTGPRGTLYDHGFPLLLTVKGAKRLENSAAFTGFGDARMKSLALPFSV